MHESHFSVSVSFKIVPMITPDDLLWLLPMFCREETEKLAWSSKLKTAFYVSSSKNQKQSSQIKSWPTTSREYYMLGKKMSPIQ